MEPMTPLVDLIGALEQGHTSSRALADACLARIADPAGEGSRAFVHVDADAVREAADAMDRLRRRGAHPSPLAGIPIAVKDLFDIRGQVTRAGSLVLSDAPPATDDAPTVRRLRGAGMIIVGRTNMTEFAYSGLGLNPHFDTPRNPWDRATGRIPGGSSSGAAVSVTDGMAAVAIGTDTGGSCRIPAALCGIVGYKPTQHRVPLDGCYPLSFSLDSIGPLGASVSCCVLLDAVLSGAPPVTPTARPAATLRLALPQTLVLEELDDPVAATFERTLTGLRAAGVAIEEIPFEALGAIPRANAKGGFASAEAYAHHRPLLETAIDRYDPRVGQRILPGREISAAEYIDLQGERTRLISEADITTAPFDAVVMPTCPIVAPTIAELADDYAYFHNNKLVLRNPLLVNFLDRCAISIPCHRPGDPPVGLMLMGENGGDAALFQAAAGIEQVLADLNA